MADPGDIIGHAVVNVRACKFGWPCGENPNDPTRCPGCRGDGTWLDTSEATPYPDPADNYPGPCLAVDQHNLDGRATHILCHKPDGHDGDHGNDRYTWPRRPLENGDTDEP